MYSVLIAVLAVLISLILLCWWKYQQNQKKALQELRERPDELDPEQLWIVRKATDTLPQQTWMYDSFYAYLRSNLMPPQNLKVLKHKLPQQTWTYDSLYTYLRNNLMPPQNLKVFNTVAHGQMVSKLFSLATNLSQGLYVGHNGNATCLLVGAKGIGKTTTVRTFTYCCPELFPNVIGVYANYLGLGENHALRRDTLVKVINCQLMGKSASSRGMLSSTTILEDWLKKEQKKLFLVIDELDELYRKQPEKVLEDTLDELQSLGNSIKGNIAVLLCGSSAMLPALISRNTSDPSFPMLQNAPNLNGHKFSAIRVFSPLPVSLDVIQGLYPGAGTTDCRSLLFYAGGNVREIEKVLKRDINVEYTSILFSPSNTNGGTAALQPFLFHLLKMLTKKNSALIQKFEKRFAETMIEPWETTFNHLDDKQTSKCWSKFTKEHKENDKKKVEALYHLSDRGFLVVTQECNVYPSNVALLLESLDFENNTPKYREILRKGLPMAAQVTLRVGIIAVKSALM